MTVVDATERLSKREFSADADWETYPRSSYTCPKCGAQIEFALRDLDRHSFSEFTNLSRDDAERVAQAARGSGRGFNSFIDFYCPGCRSPVRVCYTAWAGGRWTHGHSLSFVVET